MRKYGVGFVALVVTAGCSASTATVGRSAMDVAADEEAALQQRVDDLFATDGNTQQTELPAGTATYTGLVHGFSGGGTAPDVEYYADLSLEADFDTDSVSGTVDNFRTDMTGFTAPSGSAAVAGAISTGPGDALLGFSANATLTGTDRSADYTITTTSGNFVGDNAEAARGQHETEFLWLTGPDTGNESWSDGEWTAEQ